MKDLEKSGLNVIAISRDSIDVLNRFANTSKIKFPLLSDSDSKVIESMGLYDKSGRPGTRHEGIAHPMTMLVDSNRVLIAKLPGTVTERHGADNLLHALKKTKKRSSAEKNVETTAVPKALNFTVTNIQGQQKPLSDYLGKVVVVVNVASKCGFTRQYESLQKLYEKHKDAGLVVLGFPCNQFGQQEPGTDLEIQQFCKANYGVSFDMFSKIDVKGENQAPFYRYLTAQNIGPVGSGNLKWNFEKFIIDRRGEIVARFGTRTEPNSDDFAKKLTELLESIPNS